MKENAKKRRATLLVGLSLLCLGTINAADDRNFARVALNSAKTEAASPLTLAERVAYQYAVEEVYWRHRIWSTESRSPKPSLDDVISAAQIQQKVENYLRDSEQLAEDWRRPITSEQLQAEMDRMASQTKQPEVLQELFAALNNDPRLIAECLARPALAERLVRNFYAKDERFHGELKRRAENAARAGIESVASYKFPQIAGASSGCADDTWKSTAALDARSHHTAVWTGTEMIVWGGEVDDGALHSVSNTGWRYNPTLDTWVATNVSGAPIARSNHTAVWTGTEMIVWGGLTSSAVNDNTDTGGRYNPNSDSWAATNTNGAPTGRYIHTAVWTGSEMIIWGGVTTDGAVENTGARYNPSSDSWIATSGVNAPTGRSYHRAVWTGTEMIVWGGLTSSSVNATTNTGGRYDPITDSWVATNLNGAPSSRYGHTAVWTGSEMIVWSGSAGALTKTGGKYNPSTDSWIATTTLGAPAGRIHHTAVWTGTVMIAFGGQEPQFENFGVKYNPLTDSWLGTNDIGEPEPRSGHTAVWTGTEMIVWGGSNPNLLSTGGRYNLATDGWAPTSFDGAPQNRAGHTAVWTGTEMIIWGGAAPDGQPLVTGGRYFPSTNSWIATNLTDVPGARYSHTAVWTGTEMIVWGGYNYYLGNPYHPIDLNTGARYNPSADGWIATSIVDAPRPRDGHTAVWTGTEMIVWGGYVEADRGMSSSGGRYNPNTNSWVPTSRSGAPESRYWHTAIWTGSEMIIWGGNSDGVLVGNGGRYTPTTDSWVATTMSGAPDARSYHTAVWTGTEMIIWGGQGFGGAGSYGLGTGARYIPTSDSWAATAPLNAPEGRFHHTAVWIDGEMIVWGGSSFFNWDNPPLNTGARYNPGTNTWIATSTMMPDPTGSPYPIPVRSSHTAIWTGTEMIVWGGAYGDLHSGGRYCARLAPAHLENISTRLAVGTGNYNLIGGFIVPGTQAKRVIIRALGPSLPVSGTLANPALELHPSVGEVITNDNWRDSQEAEIIASGKAPANNAESAIIAILAPGAHTAIVRGTNETTGMALMEVWDLDSNSASTMANVSTRGFVQTGDNVMIGGTIIVGGGSSNVLVRAIGPSLSGSGLPNALRDPTLELYDGNGAILATNDNWRDTQEAAIQATGLAPTDDLDSAILQSVSSGAYTAIVRGKNETTGIALVEVYALP